MLFKGPSGSGKKSLSMALLNEVFGDSWKVRVKSITFSPYMLWFSFKISLTLFCQICRHLMI